MNELIVSITFGVLGGIIRLFVSLLKSIKTKEKINYKKAWFYLIFLVTTGAFSGIVLGFNKQLSFLGGYAGMDLLDGYFKSFNAKKIKFK